MRDKKGFSLIEILVMIAVISILMGMLVSGGTAARGKAKIYRTKSMIASLETALAMYHADFGDYPAAGNVILVDRLADVGAYGSGGSSPDPDWNGPYISLKEEDLNGTVAADGTVIDVWGNDYVYTRIGSTYKISSNGPDGGSGGGDDITSL
ncbi:MAG: prepilin-type N-terminal cleavage/methylation domain-containing protein [PVC group bacterium]|nr:prepilin-type N-terminal cleavage/methylation domain-containing protein [PVC group bacterium]